MLTKCPNLGIKKDTNYAHTAADVEPFGGVKPYKEHFLVQMEYTGPGRAIPEPERCQDRSRSASSAPSCPRSRWPPAARATRKPSGIAMLQGAAWPSRRPTPEGGYLQAQNPLRAVRRNDNALWGASGSEIIHLAYKDNVWAIIGGIDGANTHIAIRVALKIEIPVDDPRRPRPDLHRNQHPVGHALHRRRPPAELPPGGLPASAR